MYHALYRKYRPQNFSSVVGQNTIIKTLRNSIINSSFSHAYMFFGPRGTGKTTVSKIFARSINCLEPVEGNSCGKCKNCLHSYEKECVDIIEIDAASNNGVDEIRELKNKISLVPAELKYKVYIIDEVHMLSIGAFNALLKTLEEPPEHAIFVLATTDPQKVPETIISRCQCFSFKRISTEMIVDRLLEVCKEENITIDSEVLEEIAISSDGGMRDSLGMLDKLSSYTQDKITLDDFAELNGMITKNRLNKFCDYIFSDDLANVLTNIKEFNSEGKNLIQIMQQLMYFLRNLLVNYYINGDNFNYSIDRTQELVNLINEKMFDIKKSGNPKIYIEMLIIKFINDSGKTKNISREIKENTSSDFGTKKDVNRGEVNGEVLTNNVEESSTVVETNQETVNVYEKNNFNDIEEDSISDRGEVSTVELPIVKNIDEIMKARVNNTLALANKQILRNELTNMELLNDFTFDQEVGYIVCALLDAKIRAASEENIIISYEYDSVVKQNLLILDKLIYVYNKITNSNKNIAIVSDSEWEKEKSKYINSIKEGVHYTVLDEPKEVLEELEKNDIITNSAVELFGDIVEFEK